MINSIVWPQICKVGNTFFIFFISEPFDFFHRPNLASIIAMSGERSPRIIQGLGIIRKFYTKNPNLRPINVDPIQVNIFFQILLLPMIQTKPFVFVKFTPDHKSLVLNPIYVAYIFRSSNPYLKIHKRISFPAFPLTGIFWR